MKFAIRAVALAIALAGLISAPYASATTLSNTTAATAYMAGPGPFGLPLPGCGPGICPTQPFLLQ